MKGSLLRKTTSTGWFLSDYSPKPLDVSRKIPLFLFENNATCQHISTPSRDLSPGRDPVAVYCAKTLARLHGGGAPHESGNPYLTQSCMRSMAAMTTVEARITSLEAEYSTIEIQMKSQFKDLDAQKADLLDQLNVEFTKTKMGLTEVVEHAKVEFLKIRNDLHAIYGNAAAAFDEIGKRIDGLRRPRRGRIRATFRSRT